MAEAHRDEIAKLEALYAANPEGRVFTHLAEAYRKAGELELAVQVLEHGLERHADSASAYIVLGRVRFDRGEREPAATAFRRALELDSGNLVAHRFLGELAVEDNAPEEALRHYREVLNRNPGDEGAQARVEALLRPAAPTAEPDAPALAEPPGPEEPAAWERGEVERFTGESDEPEPAADTAQYLDGEFPEAAGEPGTGAPEWTTEPDRPFSEDREAAGAWEGARPDEPPGAEALAEAPLDVDAPLLDAPLLSDDDALAGEASLDRLDLGAGPEGADDLDFGAGTDEEWGAVPGSLDLSTVAEEAGEEFADLGVLDVAAEFSALGTEPPELADDVGVVDLDVALPSFAAPGASAAAASDPGYGFEDPEAESTEALDDARAAEQAWLDEDAGAGSAAEASGGLVTETMAELYRSQGFHRRAADVYRSLLAERSEDERLQQRLAEVEAELEQGGRAEERDLESVESAFTGGSGASGEQDTPYAWSGTEEPGTGAPIRDYLHALLSWRRPERGLEETRAVFPDLPATESRPDVSAGGTDAGARETGAPEGGGTEAGLARWVTEGGAAGWTPELDWSATSGGADEPGGELVLEESGGEPFPDGPGGGPFAGGPGGELVLDEPGADPVPVEAEPGSGWTPDELLAEEPASAPWGTGRADEPGPFGAPAPVDDADLMPWELPEPSGLEPSGPEPTGAALAEGWPDAAGGRPAEPADAPEPEAAEGEDESDEDEDLEMFRSWLQSLKK